jgi:hypothetical protein
MERMAALAARQEEERKIERELKQAAMEVRQ